VPELSEGYKVLLLCLAAPGLYCLLVLVGRRLKRRHGVRLGWLYHLFSLTLAVYFPASLLDVPWGFQRHLAAAVVVLGATVLVALVDRYIWDYYFRQSHGVMVPKFLTEVVRLIILLVAVFLVLDIGYGQTMKGLLFAPGLAAVVIGLAMQDLVGNIIAGVALQVGKPFVLGEWLLIENRYAEVMEINWRSTRLRTNDDISIEIPNRELARVTIVNLNRPNRPHAMRISISLDYAAPPTRVKEVLLHAAANARGLAAEPKPRVYLKNFGDSGIEYEIKFWMEDYAMFNEVSDSIRTNVWYGLRRHGIRIPFPTRTVQLERPGRDRQQEVQSAARRILRQQPLFQCLTDQQLDALLPRGRAVHFGRGELLIQQGDEGASMFILVDGRATVTVERDGLSKQVGSLNPGDCFGEMSLLTGERRSATITASADCEVVEIGKDVLAKSLEQNPRLLQQLSELLAQHQQQTYGAWGADPKPNSVQGAKREDAGSFLDKLRAFFDM